MPRIAALVLLLVLPFQGGCLYYSCNQRDKFYTGTVEDQVRIVIDRHHTAEVDAMWRVHFPGIPPFLVLNGMFGPRTCVTFRHPDTKAVANLQQAERFVQRWQRAQRLIQPASTGDPFPQMTQEHRIAGSPLMNNPQSYDGNRVVPLTSVLVAAEPFVIAVVDVPKLSAVQSRENLRETSFGYSFIGGLESRTIRTITLPNTVSIGTELPLADTVDFYIDQRPRTVTTLEAPSEPGTFVVLRDARGRAILRLHREASLLRILPADPSDDEI